MLSDYSSGAKNLKQDAGGAPRKLTDEDIRIVRTVWKYANYINAEYLHANIERWLKETTLREGISLVDRIRQVEEPGHICMDTVAHCGRSTAGSFVWSLTWTDILTGFTINRAVWNKGFEGMRAAFEYCLKHTPFEIKSINVDNGSEFLNYHTIRYWKSKDGIKLTHSRACMKNDNAHAEQRNRTHVRELFARYRFDDQRDVDEMNRIYEQTYKFRNFILPCKALKTRILNKGRQRYRRVYDRAKTPVERIMDFRDTPEEIREELKSKLASLNYYDESLKLQSLLNEFFSKERNDNADSRTY